MGLFTTTQVINDGTVDHTFVLRGQIPHPKSLISEYFEPAAMATDSRMLAKYENSNSPSQRSVFSSVCLLPDDEGVLTKCTINTSVVHDKGVALEDVEERLALHRAALAIAGTTTRFLQRMP